MSELKIPANVSPASWVRSLPPDQRQRWIQSLSREDATALEYTWGFWARPGQLSPWSPMRGLEARAAALESFTTFLACSGRGSGKTRCGSETVIEEARELRDVFRGALVARTAADVRDVIVEGESGILARSPPDFRPIWEPSRRRLTWPNGAIATTFTAEEPDKLRGPQHNFAWGDELAAWRYVDAYDQLQMGLRLQPHPRQVITTTPRPTRLVRDLLSEAKTAIMRGSTYDNAENLAPSFLAKMRRKYEGTTLGRQELHAEVMDEAPGALWRRGMFQRLEPHEVPELLRVVVAVDPSATASDDSDEAGIVVAGSFRRAGALNAVVLADYSGLLRPQQWAERGVLAFDRHRAEHIIGEVNNGGDMVETLVRMVALEMQRAVARTSGEVAFRPVHASQGKQVRAGPVVALYEQGRVWHVSRFSALDGEIKTLADLEDQCCTWVPGTRSPDRMDAAVYALTDLVLEAEEHDTGTIGLGLGSLSRRSAVRGA